MKKQIRLFLLIDPLHKQIKKLDRGKFGNGRKIKNCFKNNAQNAQAGWFPFVYRFVGVLKIHFYVSAKLFVKVDHSNVD